MEHEQPPTPEQTGTSAKPQAATSADPQARSRAKHPAGRSLRELPTGPIARRAALHYEHAAIHWLAVQRKGFDGWPAGAPEREMVLRTLGEIALLMSLRLRRDEQPLNADYSALLTMLASVAGRAETRQLLRDDERALQPLAAVQGALQLNHQADPTLGRALGIAVAERSVPGLVPAPGDQIVLHCTLNRVGIDLPCPPLSGLLDACSFADDVIALELPTRDLDGLAGLVLTASDFGGIDIRWPDGTTAAGIASALKEWLILAMADEDAGLVGALLSALTCLDDSTDEVTGLARRWLHGWQESDGRVEGRLRQQADAGAGEEADLAVWAAAVHATAMTALDSLLLRTCDPAAAPANLPDTEGTPLGGVLPDLNESIMAAADWLDAVLPGAHVAGRLWTSEAWLALGDEDEARRQLLRLAEDPQIAHAVLKQSSERAVHLAALLVVLEVNAPPLTSLRNDVAALLAHPEAAELLRTRVAATEVGTHDVALTAAQQDLRRRTVVLCSALLREGPPADAFSDQVGRLLLLSRATRAAVAAGDLGWLALVLRGLHRLEFVPGRLIQDARVFLQSHQRPDGAIGPLPVGRCGPNDRQVRWTLQVLSALVEEVAGAGFADAA